MFSSKCRPNVTKSINSLLILVFLPIAGCQFVAGKDPNQKYVEKYTTLADSYAKITAENQVIKDRLVKADEAVKVAEQVRQTLEKKVKDLQIRIDRLDPKSPPLFQKGELESGALSFRRVFSLCTGNCFDLAGYSSCLFWHSKDPNGALLVYKTNRAFMISSSPGPFSDPDGHPLSLVTPTVATEIETWELAHPNHPSLLGIR